MVETRSQAQGKPLKKPGAYNTDLYYQEKDEGFGDVGVDQEPDAGTLDKPDDPDFQVTNADVAAADKAAAAEDNNMAGDLATAAEETEDLTHKTDARAAEANREGEPVPIVETSADDMEAMDAAPEDRPDSIVKDI